MIWIKWHINCLYDYEFSKLTNSTKWVFVGLICLACKCENRIPKDYDWISKQISSCGEPIDDEMNYLFDSKMVQDCTKMVQDCTKMVQNSCLDKIREDKTREDNNVILIIEHYKIKTGYHKNDKAWDKAHFARCAVPAKKLIEFCGSAELACSCLDSVSTDMTKEKLDWNLDTILKRSAKWKLEHESKEQADTKRKKQTEQAVSAAENMGD